MVTSYQPSGMGFVGPGHCQWWAGTPLSNQNPHIWAFIFTLFIAGALFVLWRYTRSKKTAQDNGSKFDKLYAEMEAKEKRLKLKIRDLEERLVKGTVGQAEYKELSHQYNQQLIQVAIKLKEMKNLHHA